MSHTFPRLAMPEQQRTATDYLTRLAARVCVKHEVFALREAAVRLLMAAAEHEFDELFHVDGGRYFDPHTKERR